MKKTFLLVALVLLSQASRANITPKQHKTSFVPIVLALIAELTLTDVALAGATAGVTAYVVTNPPPAINWPGTIQEVPDVPGWKPTDPNFRPGKMPDWKDVLIRIGLFGGTSVYIMSNQYETSSFQDQMEQLYFTNPNFAAYINQMQLDYDAGKQIAIPVCKSNSLIFDHFIYLKKMESLQNKIKPQPTGPKMQNSEVEEIKNFLDQKQMWKEINELFPESDLLIGSSDWSRICDLVDCSCITDQKTIPDPCIYGIAQWIQHVLCVKRLVDELKTKGEHELAKKLWYDQVVFPGKLYQFCEPKVLQKVVEVIHVASKELFG